METDYENFDEDEEDEKKEEPDNVMYEENDENANTGLTEKSDYNEDFIEVQDDEYTPEDEKEWEMGEEEGEEAEVTDWEKEAKKKVRIEMEEPTERRRTIFELDSYASSGPSLSDILKISATDVDTEPPKRIRYSVSMGMTGIARINLSPLTQKIIGCVVGENVTTEYPWIYVRKEIIEDNIDLHEESSDFLPMKDEIEMFPDSKMLIGYAPSLIHEGQFYICLTEAGRDAVVENIRIQREEHENRVRNAVYKPGGEWDELGSSVEIDESIVRDTRPRFEIEVMSTPELLRAPMNLSDRNADDQRDGYIELVPYRETFDNVQRVLIHRPVQVTSIARANEAQTAPSMPVNSWFQYEYKYRPIDLSTLNEEQIESLKMFLDRYTGELCDQAMLNATWDIYTNDYGNLVRDEVDTQSPVPQGYKEHQNFHGGKYIIDKVINDLSWHPLWTGIAFAAYTRYSKSDRCVGPKTDDEVLKACEGDNHVLAWSFNDCLTPKLALECPREVTAVATCPLDGNVIVGGCANGQVAIWHISGKIEQVEAVVVHTTAQVKYRIAMKTLTTWMREPIGSSVVTPAAMSSLKESQKGAINQIIWVPSHYKVDKNGRIKTLPEDTPFEDLTLQFATASEDGTIAFWDLKCKPSAKEIRKVARKKQQVARPEALVKSVSPYKVLDRILKPDYILVVQYPDESRRQVITTMSMFAPKFGKERVNGVHVSEDITVRRFYKPTIKKPDFVMEPKILVGTVEGDFGCITWEGYEFTTDVTVNRELCKWSWIKRIHDGPVTHSVRSKYYTDIVATVGGKVFAVWRKDFGHPLIWKKANVGYTACSWGSFRPTILILARMDGSVEIWDLLVKSQEPCLTQSLSGRIITGIYTHELDLNPQCVGFCDFNGILRMFLAPGAFLKYNQTDIEWMKKFIDRQVDRITEFETWQKEWNEANHESIEIKKRKAEMETEKKQLEEEKRIKAELAKASALLVASKKSIVAQKPWQFIEAARARWKSMELQRMQRVILEKKGLRKDDLERQRAPILKMRMEARRKKQKIREILQLQDKIFEDTVAFLFPEQYHERKRSSLPTIDSERKHTIDLSMMTENLLRTEVKDYSVDPDEEIIYDFMKVQTEALASLQNRPFEHSFDWRKVLMQGKSRRSSMDAELRKLNKPRKKFVSIDEGTLRKNNINK